MKTIINILFLFFSVFTVLAQTSIAPLSYNQNQIKSTPSNARLNSSQIIDTLKLPFIDDFSSSTTTPDTTLWENTGGVYINNHYTNNAPTKNTASFDGIKEDGFPYVFPTNSTSSLSITGNTDYLISKPINIEEFDSTNNLAFSFFWQMGGNHEYIFPDLSKGDFMKLFFFNADSNWVQVWPITSEDSNSVLDFKNGDDFEYKFLPITDSSYFHAGFKFKFETHGILTGNWSMWQVDYVMLDTNRTDQNIQDFAFSGQVSSLLKGFSAIPYNQFVSSPESFINDTISAIYNTIANENNFRDSLNTVVFDDQTEIINNTSLFAITIAGNSSTNIKSAIDKDEIINYVTTKQDRNTSLDYSLELLGSDQVELIESNDIVRNSNYISDYIAYDDGTPEASIAVSFKAYGQAAYQFDLVSRDTLTAIYIQWSKAGQDISGSTVNIKVWKALKGINGATEDIEILKSVSVIDYNEDINGFTRIDLNQQLILEPGVFYVGWEQYSPEKIIKVATDMSQNNMDKFYQLNNSTWSNPNLSEVYGSPLIRPKFGYGNSSGMGPVGLEKEFVRRGVHELEIYPNPANETLTIEGQFNSIKIYNLTGGIVWETSFTEDQTKHEIITSDFPEGLYIIEASNKEKYNSKRLTITH